MPAGWLADDYDPHQSFSTLHVNLASKLNTLESHKFEVLETRDFLSKYHTFKF